MRLCEQQDCCLVAPFTGKNNPYPPVSLEDMVIVVKKVRNPTPALSDGAGSNVV